VSRLLAALLLVALLSPAADAAGAAGGDTLAVSAQEGGVRIDWRGEPPASPTAGWTSAAPRDLPAAPGTARPTRTVSHTEAVSQRIPLRLVPLLVSGEGPVELRDARAASRAAVPAATDAELPGEPLFVLREGRLAGSRIVVVAVSPYFDGDEGARVASSASAFVPGAKPLAGALPVAWAERGPGISAAPGPTNPAFGRAAARVIVAAGGMQRVPAAALAAAGLDPAAAGLRLWRDGAAIPVELRGEGAGRELRFYAPAPGDRWNRADTYWITAEPAPGPAIATRDVTPGAAPARDTALETGEWRAPTTYDSREPGPDGDHWFNVRLKAGGGAPPATAAVPFAAALPATPGSVVLTLSGTAGTAGPHSLSLTSGGATASGSWQGAGDWSLALPLGAANDRGELTLRAGAAPSAVAVDAVAWERPVRLELAGRGARFRGLPGRWRYSLGGRNTADDLYDVTDPNAPARLTGVAVEFEDEGGRDYLVAGAGTLHEPEVRAAAGAALPAAVGAVYIAPAALHAALSPLAELRRAQGFSAAVVDVQTIYDAWSGGQVDPAAVRAFLRYAAASWPAPPRAATLVGDGTTDPHGYSLAGSQNLIPPYMAMVDPWLGETACEPCMAQLDGDSPLDDPLPDIALGRLPVKSAAELEALVTKLVRYETASGGMDWRSRALFVADNGFEADGRPDPAGDFAALADAGVALLPAGVRAARVYYDPWMDGTRAPSAAESWREPDAVAAHRATVAALTAGAGLVTYVGHSHHWQWASTGAPALPDEQFLLGLNDAGLLGNGGRLPVMLELTCLTAAFQKPAESGTTLDERLLLNPGGGAAAVWGSTGMGVAYGHDALQRGFHGALWGGAAPRMGALVEGGQLELFAAAGCCQDALHTYALLGDPLTLVRASPAGQVALPLVRR
jgi:hypothetical protein